MKRLFHIVALALCVLPAIADAANQYVRPGATGRNDGTDWTNAYTALPATLKRGDVYYLADGSYGSRTFSDANSASTTITLKKATEADHGTDTGWTSTYGDGQAVFTSWRIYTDYYVFDGQRRNGDWTLGTTSEYGIRVAGTGPVRLDNGAGTGGDNLTFRYIDIQGGGRDTGSGDDVIYGLTGNSNITFQYCALHDSDRTIFLTRQLDAARVDHSYLARNTSTPAIHGEMMSVYSSTDVTLSNNVIEDIEGTAVFAGIGGRFHPGRSSATSRHSAAYAADTGRKSGHNFGVAGLIFIANDATNNNTGNNVLVYNNTLENMKGTWSGVVIQRGSGNEVRNNVWYASVRTNNSFSGKISNNWYYNTPQDGDSTATKTVCTSGATSSSRRRQGLPAQGRDRRRCGAARTLQRRHERRDPRCRRQLGSWRVRIRRRGGRSATADEPPGSLTTGSPSATPDDSRPASRSPGGQRFMKVRVPTRDSSRTAQTRRHTASVAACLLAECMIARIEPPGRRRSMQRLRKASSSVAER